jgi:ArsR family transcriptional regulator, lead/cadmium/zinc/bismuth-responsive transcriptional repressor
MSNHSDSSYEYPRIDPPGGTDAECSAVVLDPTAVGRVRNRLSDDGRIEQAAAIFSALADPTRVRILEALGIEELCVCDLAAVCGISQSGVSHQLRLLRDLRLVTYRREGNRAVYRPADGHVPTLLAQGLEHAGETADST